MSSETQFTQRTAREAGQRGGRKSGAARREKRKLRDRLEALLLTRHNDMEAADAICIALLEKALAGDVRAYEVIRDTIGEKPTDKVQAQTDGVLVVKWKA